ncbi:hypothetical protein Q0812_01540 [Brevundimonas sp. 2R-24]|uniref:DUF308 domain-containing protein n=1 Tax=Peiella sedimenti TaxID=3061083 RepID=A0ABT8SI24_9CAUL|nr:hypothetical protein [Caulobacteraceae bacterium XZ-24]
MRADVVKTGQWYDTALRALMWGGAGALLLAPAVAMRFTSEVNWTGSDFIFAGVLLFSACGTIELALRASGALSYRAGVATAVGTAFLLIWANLAVGIFGDEDNAANLWLFAGPLAAVIGAIVARGRARRMMWAMIAAGAVQAAMGAVAAQAGAWELDPRGLWQGLIASAVFTGMWLLAAAFFSAAGRSARD